MLIKDYYHDEKLRKSMSKLATETFGLDFENLYQSGYWGEPFGCYGIVKDDDVVSNVSYHLFDYEKDNKKYSAMQIGTVMTHPDHRHQGLLAKLMNEVLTDHPVDVVYLFGNEEVMDFYPKFGFESLVHLKYKTKVTDEYIKGDMGQKLDIDKDRTLIDSYIKSRLKNSRNDYVYKDDYVKMFYLMYLYSDCIYLHDNCIIVCEKEDDVLWVHDVFLKSECSLYECIGPYTEGVRTIYFGFEARVDGLEVYEDKDSGLFVKTNIESLKKPWSYPTMSVT